MKSFIDEKLIEKLLNEKTDEFEVDEILMKAKKMKGLELAEVAKLINVEDSQVLEKIFSAANYIKDEIYGNRLVIFAPQYVSNYCNNNCLYCGFRSDNKELKRKCLTTDEIKKEVELILEQGHKRILMLMGEQANECDFDHFLKSIDAAYSVKDSKGNSIRRINVEIAPLTNADFRKISKVKIGTYTVFQESYHQETYKKMHPVGKKSDYFWRLFCMDRALNNGLGDVGIGALFGLYDYRFEVLAMVMHAEHLDKKFGVGPHTISIPRIEHAQNAPAAENIPHPVSDQDFKKLVAVLRLAVPYTGMILSTRETAKMREDLFDLGVSQISAGSKTNPGGYEEADCGHEDEEQFSVSDTRSTDEVIKGVIKQGYVPSFCTGCYRLGRVGQDFMDMAKPGLIKMHCLPNALTTLKEYLVDYADEDTKVEGDKLILKELENIPSDERREKTKKFLKEIEDGKRDLYF